ncbi:hypothetical protein RJ639_047141 [Escallonia herrerae]|uniref:Uncharacterized protein n=1 Tax=Escallonia herrerae TaxID=1293975 RepID=A0AA88W5F6_9ASTE|nr:hypothetical protein RJ639_047141 [Escallonia herrerae]
MAKIAIATDKTTPTLRSSYPDAPILGCKDQKISENFYVRGDGTRAFYFADEFLTRLFKENGFETEEYDVYCKQIMEVKLSDWVFKIRELSKEYQHTCKSTGLMLWESARLMASILAANQSIVSGKRVLELGSGCGGICSMVAARSADLVVATDGNETTLELLSLNVSSNLQSSSRSNLITKVLQWGNKDHIGSIKQLSDEGFEIILGTDVTYIPEAISPLFSTARELISVNKGVEEVHKPALILCHVLRRVDEPSIISAAAHFGFKLVDRWPLGSSNCSISKHYRCMMQVEDYLYQKDLYLPLVGEKPDVMNANEWLILDQKVLATVRLSLTPQVAVNISKEKTTVAVMQALKKLYEKHSASNKASAADIAVYFIKRSPASALNGGIPEEERSDDMLIAGSSMGRINELKKKLARGTALSWIFKLQKIILSSTTEAAHDGQLNLEKIEGNKNPTDMLMKITDTESQSERAFYVADSSYRTPA